MGNIVTNQEVSDYLRLKNERGEPMVVSATSDPNTAYLDLIVNGVEGEFDTRTRHSWGHLTHPPNLSLIHI